MATAENKPIVVQGRIVWTAGDLFKGRQKTDNNTGVLRLNKKGEPMMEYGFGLAVPLASFQKCGPGEPGYIWTKSQEQARLIYPSGQFPPGFAWKFKNGDTDIGPDGTPLSTRTGYAGHLVFACTTSLPIVYCIWKDEMNHKVDSGIKCGDYVNVSLQIESHPAIGTSKPGLYMNPLAVQLLREGEAIMNRPSINQFFGTAQPAGWDPTPVGPPNMFMQGGPQTPMGGPQMPQMAPGQPSHLAPVTPSFQMPQQAPVVPNYAPLPPQFQPQAPVMPQQPMQYPGQPFNPNAAGVPQAPQFAQNAGQPGSPFPNFPGAPR